MTLHDLLFATADNLFIVVYDGNYLAFQGTKDDIFYAHDYLKCAQRFVEKVDVREIGKYNTPTLEIFLDTYVHK